jgi:Family of unknown function (DUF5999)
MCPHRPPCPPADRPDRDAAHTIAFHPEQGWSLLCNGMIVFDDRARSCPTAGQFRRTTPPASGCPSRREKRGRALACRDVG